ncbi:nuclear transport factor 2 family protein [Rhodococcus sp. NPDC003382]|uniref:nuclear transport factor 2 family protein n=1 Tax=unclassified Rhodococcus (in: high G+C Gram-positive bacteria) TaxID=192944 RepID=UPI0018CF567A|nr:MULTISPECIES: nuclear transport factor 2 family protein [unclassified Rhodococcus (in: high G+C Gram-positive bacteria)]MBH0118980.1 nuclear transport factor 2 family protein [Rhodococcus sp. CX]MCK8672735.1 nuclear transport factor 2 family protein [Rhodococcus sp. HM1]
MDREAVSAIERVKYRYARALDTKEWVEFADTLTPEATAVYGEHLSFESRDAFVGFLANTLGAHVVTEHHCSHPEIDVAPDGKTATGVWLLADTVVVPEDGMLLRGSAYYHDRYALCDDGKWRISHTSYERNWETVVSLDDLPSFRLTSNRWDLLEVPRAS